jgi:DNA-binding beta-propeller fold protein YncE
MRRSDRVLRTRRNTRRHPGIRVAFIAALVLAIGGAAIALANTDDHHARTGAQQAQAASGSASTAAGKRQSTGSGPHQSWTTTNVYAHTKAGMFTPVTRQARYLIYVPDSRGSGVYVINPNTYKVIRYIQTGTMVQHVVPAWDLRTLYATNDTGNSLTPINPDTGKRAGPNIPVADPYNMYFTPGGRHAIVVEEAAQTLAVRDPHTLALQKTLDVHCPGVDHMDFSANGRFALASCEFSGQMVRIDLRTETVAGYVQVGGSPQDVKLSPDGRTFYVANRFLPNLGASGVQLIDARTMRLVKFMRTPLDTHGLYVSRNTKDLYVTSRAGGAISVINFATRRIVATWKVPGTPDMGGVSPNGKVLWLAGRYTGSVYAISTTDGHVLATIPAGISPHGLCVWPQPGRFSTGHTGVMR